MGYGGYDNYYTFTIYTQVGFKLKWFYNIEDVEPQQQYINVEITRQFVRKY